MPNLATTSLTTHKHLRGRYLAIGIGKVDPPIMALPSCGNPSFTLVSDAQDIWDYCALPSQSPVLRIVPLYIWLAFILCLEVYLGSHFINIQVSDNVVLLQCPFFGVRARPPPSKRSVSNLYLPPTSLHWHNWDCGQPCDALETAALYASRTMNGTFSKSGRSVLELVGRIMQTDGDSSSLDSNRGHCWDAADLKTECYEMVIDAMAVKLGGTSAISVPGHICEIEERWQTEIFQYLRNLIGATALSHQHIIPNMETTATGLSATVYATIGEVRTLMIRSEKVAEAFEDIKAGLREVDHINPPHFDDNWNAVERLQPTWNKYHERFVRVCELSSNNVTLAQQTAREFCEDVLPCVLCETASIVHKFDTLIHFYERENPINISDCLVKEIATLQQDIWTFSTSANLTDHMSDQLAVDIQLLLSEIDAGILGSISGLSWIWSLANNHAALLGNSDLERIGSDEFVKAHLQGMTSAYKILECTLKDYSLRMGSLR